MTRIYQSELINELATALAMAQAEITHASKDSNNPFYKSKYAALPDVIDAARPALTKHGLSVTQLTDFDEKGEAFLVTQLIHKSGQWMRSWYPVNPIKRDPQGYGSAYTYARRYSYSCITGVVASDEDDDGEGAQGRGKSTKISATNGEKTAAQVYGSAAAWGRAMDALEKEWAESISLKQLETATKENKIHLDAVKDIDPECHADMQKKYLIHKTRIEQDIMMKEQLGE